MKKLSLFVALFVLGLCVGSTTAVAQTSTEPSNWDGGGGGPYEIATLNNLFWLSQITAAWDDDFILTADIAASGTAIWDGGAGFSPIGNISTASFTGSFDGQGYVITGLTINRSTQDYVGLFGFVLDVTISNLGLEGGTISGKRYVGGLVGHSEYSSIESCSTTGAVSGSSDSVGGLVGSNSGTITSCYATGAVSGTADYVGGLVGYAPGGTITSCYATGAVLGTANYVGGLVGASSGTPFNSSSITTCYATGAVSGTTYVGGLVGSNGGAIGYSYATGVVTGSSPVGALVGNNGSSAANCYYNNEVNGGLAPIGAGNQFAVIGLSSDAMIVASNFALLFALDNVWAIVNGVTMPYLAWQDTFGLGGSGAYLIDSLEDLRIVSYVTFYWDKDLYLTADIDASDTVNWNGGSGFSPIGNYSTTYFTGSFDGQGYVITGLYINRPEPGLDVGLFGTTNGATISNLGLEGGTVSGRDYVGGLMGYSQGSTITSCYATVAVTGINNIVGGLVAYTTGGTITSCYATGAVSGGNYVGGLLGHSQGGAIITSCYSTGAVEGPGSYVGGLVGRHNASVTDCYWDMDTSGQATSDGGSGLGGTGLQTSDMQFSMNFVGFDFTGDGDWGIVPGQTRPYLLWQVAAVFEGTATPIASLFTLDKGYVYNVSGSGVTLDEYGVACREVGSSLVTFHIASTTPITKDSGLALDGLMVREGLEPDTSYLYRVYAIDSNGATHYGTERSVTTTTGLYDVYVQIGYVGPEVGTFPEPFDSWQEGIDNVASGGRITIISGDSYEQPLTISKPMTINSLETVRVGVSPLPETRQ